MPTSSTGEIGNGHDARVGRVEIKDASVELWFDHLEVFVAEAGGILGVWACTAKLAFEAPEAVNASWHRMSLWVLDSKLTVGGVPYGWEVLLTRHSDVSLALEWSNGASLSIVNARSALLEITPQRRVREAREDG